MSLAILPCIQISFVLYQLHGCRRSLPPQETHIRFHLHLLCVELYNRDSRDEAITNTGMATSNEIVGIVVSNVKKMETEVFNVKIEGYEIQITMPSSFEDICSSDQLKFNTFFAQSLEEDYDDRLAETLSALNEKIRCVRMDADCVATVFDNIVQVFDQYKCSKPSKQDEGGSPIRVTEKQPEPYVYTVAEDAGFECEQALFLADENSISDSILPWCSVFIVPSVNSVELEVEIKGIIGHENIATALGFSLDDPLVIKLIFGHSKWFAKEPNLDLFQYADVCIRQTAAELAQLGISMENEEIELDENTRNAIVKKWSSRTPQYGPRVLVPKLVKEYFLQRRIENDGNLNAIEATSEESNNILVGLLNFLGSRLKSLGNWCVFCRKELPPLSRLWCCNDPLWFEELGVGASVLHELQNTELTDFELTLAAAATTQCRDVFEPYPTFLLKKPEIRKRSGFFSDYIADESKQKDYLANKKLDLLSELFDSIPQIPEMQKCSTEIELAVKLGISWLQGNYNGNTTDKSDEEYAEIFWLPYNIVKYVMFTNRSSLELIQDNSKLDIKGTRYQFAVFYDSKAEQDFESRRKTRGSVFAFHGSSLSNWYSIIRNGLRCLSNTRYMSTGNSYGDGIYLSTSIAQSYKYAHYGTCSVFGSSSTYSVVALCEILSGNYNSIYGVMVSVVPPENQKDVVIRYLLVFSAEGGRGDAFVNEGHMLSSNTDLHDHYQQLRMKYVQKVLDGGGLSTEECMEIIDRRKQNLRV